MKRRASDAPFHRSYWDQAVTRRNLVLGFMLTSMMFAIALGWTIRVQDEVQSNQCHVLNRLAETKLFIRGFLRQSGPDDATEATRYRVADRELSEGIVSLERDIIDTSRCDLFRSLAERDRTGEK